VYLAQKCLWGHPVVLWKIDGVMGMKINEILSMENMLIEDIVTMDIAVANFFCRKPMLMLLVIWWPNGWLTKSFDA